MLKNIFKKRQSFVPLEKSDWLVLLLGITIFTIITFATITKSSIWFDEAFGAYLIRFDFWHIAAYTAFDVHPPLYYWLLKIWSLLFGTSELALRSMSTFFASIAIFFAFLFTKRVFGRNAAWIGLVFMVLSPMFVRYGQEMRMYTLVAAIAFAASYMLVVASESKRRLPWIMYGLLVGLGMWTHYFSALIWLAHWAWRAWAVRENNKSISRFVKVFFSKEWILAYGVAIASFLPWIPALLRQVLDVQVNGFWIPPVVPATIPNFFTNVLYYQDQETVNPWAALFLVALIVIIVTLAVRVMKHLDNTTRRWYMLLLALAFIPAAILFVASMPPLRSSFIDRYLIPSTLAIPLFLAVTLVCSAKFTKVSGLRIVGGLVVIAMLFGISNVYALGNYNKTLHNSNNTRQTIEALTAKAGDDEPIIADTPWTFYEAIFYETKNHPVYFLDLSTKYEYGSLKMLQENDQFKIKDIDTFTKDHAVVWYIGKPGAATLTAPSDTWIELNHVDVNDSVSGKPQYRAIQYLTK